MSEDSTRGGQNITFGNITEANVHQLKKMNAAILPVRYHDKFYTDLPGANPDFTQFGEPRPGEVVSIALMQYCRIFAFVQLHELGAVTPMQLLYCQLSWGWFVLGYRQAE